jgi:hypothetical protein
MELEEKALVGCFPGRKMYCECLKDYVKLNFEPLVSYAP